MFRLPFYRVGVLDHPLNRTPKGLPRRQTIANSVCTCDPQASKVRASAPWGRPPPPPAQGLYYSAFFLSGLPMFRLPFYRVGVLDHPLDRTPKGLPRRQTIANSVCTSRRSHVDKQLPILYVRRDDFLGRVAALRLFLRPPSEQSESQCPWGRPRPRRQENGPCIS